MFGPLLALHSEAPLASWGLTLGDAGVKPGPSLAVSVACQTHTCPMLWPDLLDLLLGRCAPGLGSSLVCRTKSADEHRLRLPPTPGSRARPGNQEAGGDDPRDAKAAGDSPPRARAPLAAPVCSKAPQASRSPLSRPRRDDRGRGPRDCRQEGTRRWRAMDSRAPLSFLAQLPEKRASGRVTGAPCPGGASPSASRDVPRDILSPLLPTELERGPRLSPGSLPCPWLAWLGSP